MYTDLHVLDTPIVTLLPSSPAGVLLLKPFLLEPIPSIYVIYVFSDDVEMQDENQSQLTNAVPPISRLNSKAVRGRRRTCVFGLPRALCSLFLQASM